MRTSLGLLAALLLGLAGCASAPGTVDAPCRQADGGAAADGGTASACDPGLTCLQLLACDPPQTDGPDCGEKCVDCSHPDDKTQAQFCSQKP